MDACYTCCPRFSATPAVFAFGQTGSGKTYTIIGPGMAGMQGFEDGPADPTAAVTPAYCSTPTPVDHFPQTDSAGTAPDSPASSSWGRAQPSQQQQHNPQQQRQLSEHEGLLARCVHQLYASIAERRDSVQCSVSISCTEVYNETVTDMLAKKKGQQLPVSAWRLFWPQHSCKGCCSMACSSCKCQARQASGTCWSMCLLQ